MNTRNKKLQHWCIHQNAVNVHYRPTSSRVTAATTLLPVLEVPEEDAHNTGISTANSGLIADTDSDFLIGCDGASEYAASLRRHMNKTPSLGRPETLGDGAAELGSRRRSLNAAKEQLAYDM